MLGVVVLLRLSARQWAAGHVCLLAAAVVLTLDPWAMLQSGFWLSFVAVAVLLWTDQRRSGMHSVGASDAPAWCPVWMYSWLRRGWGLFREQSVVTLALAPLCLLFFGQVSVVGLLANLVAIPWVSFVVTPLAMLGVLWPGLAVLAAWALQPLTVLLVWMAAWPGASVQLALPPWGFAALALCAALLWLSAVPRAWKVASLSLLWPALFWTAPRPAMGTYELLITDVGQGNAVLVRTANHSLLYDAGPRYSAESDAGHRVLVPLLAQTAESWMCSCSATATVTTPVARQPCWPCSRRCSCRRRWSRNTLCGAWPHRARCAAAGNRGCGMACGSRCCTLCLTGQKVRFQRANQIL
jgi:competence protein ComEC